MGKGDVATQLIRNGWNCHLDGEKLEVRDELEKAKFPEGLENEDEPEGEKLERLLDPKFWPDARQTTANMIKHFILGFQIWKINHYQ